MIEALILDMDGTLLHLPVDYVRLKQRLREFLGTGAEFNPLFKTIATLTSGDQAKYRGCLQIIDEEELKAIDGMRLSDDSRAILQTFRSRSYPLCLVTLQGRRPAHECLRRADIKDFFQVVLTRDDNIERYEQIKTCVEFLKKSPANVLVIGDRLNDVLSAQRIGCRSVLIRRDAYLELGDDVVAIEKLGDLPLAIHHFDNKPE